MARTGVTMEALNDSKPRSLRELREEAKRAELELSIQEARYSSRLLESVLPKRLHEAAVDSNQVVEDEPGWIMLSSAGKIAAESKDLTGFGVVANLRILRQQCYRAWRFNPHARGILRNLVKFVIGREFKVDFQDQQRGKWSSRDQSKLVKTGDGPPPRDQRNIDKPLTQLVWNDFTRRASFLTRAKELVLRTFRDGECFVRRFPTGPGRVTIRFIEPDHIQAPYDQRGKAEVINARGEKEEKDVVIREGIEYLVDDVETVVAYHVKYPLATTTERVDAVDIIHVKCLADTNDLRGIPVLEPILKTLTDYQQWQEYRVVLNKVRTAVALVRKIDSGTSTQAANLIAGRLPARAAPENREPQTTSGRREAMPKAGTILTPGPGVSYEFTSPRLEARDAGEDGRRIMLSAAAGVGMPEMIVTGDWSNNNYASSAEAIATVTREWEDWQDFFTPVFERIIDWVLSAAIDGLGLPEETDRTVELQWPTIMRKDSDKETQRREKLFAGGVLSRRTWAAQEGLVFDDERENMAEDEDESTNVTGDTDDDQHGGEPDDNMRDRSNGTGRRRPAADSDGDGDEGDMMAEGRGVLAASVHHHLLALRRLQDARTPEELDEARHELLRPTLRDVNDA